MHVEFVVLELIVLISIHFIGEIIVAKFIFFVAVGNFVDVVEEMEDGVILEIVGNFISTLLLLL